MSSEVYNLVKAMVDARINSKISPCHVMLDDIIKKASKEIQNFNEEKLLNELRELVRSKKLYSGRNSQKKAWLSYKENNITF